MTTATRAASLRRVRDKARRDLASYALFCGDYRPARHHRLMCASLQMAIEGYLKRVMILAPPGAAKSTYSSVYAPSWALAKIQGLQLLACSHTQSLADDFSRRTRSQVRSARHVELFGQHVDPSESNVRSWTVLSPTSRIDSRYRAAGVQVGIAGRRSHLGIIDDPFRSRKDADSEVVREGSWQWYLTDFRPRLLPGAPIIIVNTRWHEDDIAGRILPESYNGESGWVRARDGEWWFVLSIQALCEREDDILGRAIGESYWPDYYTRAILENERRIQTPRNWSALYQQRPSPDEGGYYNRQWFQWYDHLPANVRYYGASDYAVTDDGGDWTVHVVGAAVGPRMFEDLYIVDYWTGQAASDEWIQSFIDLVLRYRPVEWAEENGQISRSLGPVIDTEQRRQGAQCLRSQFPVAGDKAQRGQAFRAVAAQRRVYLPRHAPWSKDLLERLLRWQTARRDDDHDALALLGRLVYGMRGHAEPKPRNYRPAPGTYDWLLKVTDEQGMNHARKSIYRSN